MDSEAHDNLLDAFRNRKSCIVHLRSGGMISCQFISNLNHSSPGGINLTVVQAGTGRQRSLHGNQIQDVELLD